MIRFKKLITEGFGSLINPFEFRFEKDGLILIKGENGVGKTTLFSALAWALYGVTLKNKGSVETWPHLRPSTFKGTMVHVSLKKGKDLYEIIRFKDYRGDYLTYGRGKDRLLLIINGTEFVKYQDKNDLKKKIISILGLSFDLFRVSVLFGQKIKRLMEEDGPMKKEIFEEAFNIGYIEDAKVKAGKERDTYAMEMATINKEVQTQETLLAKSKEVKESTETLLSTWGLREKAAIAEIKSNIASIKAKITKLKGKRVEIPKSNTSLKGITKEADKLGKELSDHVSKTYKLSGMRDSLKVDIPKYEAQIKKAKKSDICPTCGQEMDKVKHAEHLADIELALNTANNALKEVNLSLVGRDKTAASLSKAIKELNLQENNLKQLDSLIEQQSDIEDDIKTYESDLLKEKEKLNNRPGAEMAETLNETIEKETHNIERITEGLKMANRAYRRAKAQWEMNFWMVNTPLSNSGLKAFIFNQRLGEVNKRLEYYSDFIGFKPRFMVDMKSARKDILVKVLKDGIEVPLEDLSGGQAQLVNVAAAFSTHDVVSSTAHFNILILDEIFENLSETNVDIVTDLIVAKTGNKLIYLITHKKDFTPANARVMEYKLINGNTILE